MKIAADTYVSQQVQPALGQPLFVYINSMVILGKEPVIVDTGTPAVVIPSPLPDHSILDQIIAANALPVASPR